VINGCSLGKKMVSVCASNDFSASSGYLQYRFGQKDTLELAFPNLAESARASQSVQARTLMFAGGGGGSVLRAAGAANAQTAAHLVDHVIPNVPVRQWVLSLPFQLF